MEEIKIDLADAEDFYDPRIAIIAALPNNYTFGETRLGTYIKVAEYDGLKIGQIYTSHDGTYTIAGFMKNHSGIVRVVNTRGTHGSVSEYKTRKLIKDVEW